MKAASRSVSNITSVGEQPRKKPSFHLGNLYWDPKTFKVNFTFMQIKKSEAQRKDLAQDIPASSDWR